MAITRTTGTVSNIINSPIENSSTLYPEFKCRAWVNFNGTSALNLTGTYSQSGTTITVTINNHGLLTGHQVRLSFDSGTASWGTDSVNPTVTRVDNNTFTLISGASKSTSGNTTAYFRTIRGSGNVSNVSYNGTGDYTVNFITPIIDSNYATPTSCALTLTGNGGSQNGDIYVNTQQNNNYKILTSNAGTFTDMIIVTSTIFR